jgi:hypothetical protein
MQSRVWVVSAENVGKQEIQIKCELEKDTGRDHLEDLCADGRIITCMLK